VVTRTSESEGGRRMAQSSPIPRVRVLLREVAKSWRICSISASSPSGLRDFFICWEDKLVDRRWLICGSRYGKNDSRNWLHGCLLFVTLFKDAQERSAIWNDNC
jgi:hypothetical protein